MGLKENCNMVYLIDYGLAKRYINSVTRQHIPFNEKKSMVGTPRYCSINSQMGCEQSRRDDLESLGYCLIYMLKGKLPWQGVKGVTKREKNDLVLKMKLKISLMELCKGLPREVFKWMEYCRNLKFEEKPSYPYLHKLLHSVFSKTCLKEFQFDWNLKRNPSIKKQNDKNNKNNKDSNSVEYEDKHGKPQKNISRMITINNLALKVKQDTDKKEHNSKNNKKLNVNSKGELMAKKDANKFKSAKCINPEENKVENTDNKSKPRRKLTEMKTIIIRKNVFYRSKKVKPASQGESHKNEAANMKYFLDSINNPKIIINVCEDKKEDEIFCDFNPSEITERNHKNGKGEY